MTLIRNLITARAMSVEPIARALWPDPLGSSGPSFARSSERWRLVAIRAAQAHSVADPAGGPAAGRRWGTFQRLIFR